jgi:hypothetical protein
MSSLWPATAGRILLGMDSGIECDVGTKNFIPRVWHKKPEHVCSSETGGAMFLVRVSLPHCTYSLSGSCQALVVAGHWVLHQPATLLILGRHETRMWRNVLFFPWFQASAAMLMRSALFWGSTQHRLLILYRRFGTRVGPIFKGQEDGTDTLSRNVGKGLPLDAA